MKIYGWTNLNIQINSNILDQRLLEVDATLERRVFKEQNIEIWVRSVFLQGVLLDQTLKNPFIDHPDVINFFSIWLRLSFSLLRGETFTVIWLVDNLPLTQDDESLTS